VISMLKIMVAFLLSAVGISNVVLTDVAGVKFYTQSTIVEIFYAVSTFGAWIDYIDPATVSCPCPDIGNVFDLT